MNKFQRKVNRRALRLQNKLYREIEEKYPDDTVMITVPSEITPLLDQIVFGPNLDAYIEDINNVPSIYGLKKQIRKELKNK